MKKIARLQLYLAVSLGFGLIMGGIFPLFASFFVQYTDTTHKILFMIGCVLAGLIVGGVSYLIGKIVIIGYLREPVDRLRRLTSSGEKNQKGYSDPLTELFKGIDSTGAALSGLVSKVKVSEQQIKEIQTTLDRMLRSIEEQGQKSILEMESTKELIEDNRKILQGLNTEMQTGSKRMEGMQSYAEDLYGDLSQLIENITTHFREADQSESGMLHLGDSYKKLTEGMKQSAQRIMRFRETIGHYGSQVFQLKESVAMIDNFAEETQVYSINANIEAANAGSEAGRGFRVIAEGISRLAEEIRGNAAAIEQELNAASARSGDLIAHAENRSQEVEELSRQLHDLHTQQNGLLLDLKGKNSENSTLTGELHRKGEELNRMGEDLSGIQQAYGKLKSELQRVDQAYSGMTDEVKKNQDMVQHQLLDFQKIHETFNRLSALIQEQNRTVEILNQDENCS